MIQSYKGLLILVFGLATLAFVVTGLSTIRTAAAHPHRDDQLRPIGKRTEKPRASEISNSKLIAANLTPGVEPIQSDDFDTCAFSPIWTHFQGRPGDPAPILSDTALSLSVPNGLDHDTYWEGISHGNRIMQPALNTDFEVEAKFISGVGEKFQTQGILVEQDNNDLLRFEFYGKNRIVTGTGTITDTYIYTAKIVDGKPSHIPDGNMGTVIASDYTTPLYIRVKREGNNWTHSYSFDGSDWKVYQTFAHTFSATAIGVYGGNASDDGESAPAHTAIIDYFYNTADPGTDDDQQTLTVGVVGRGSISRRPNLVDYACDQEVVLEATANEDWAFVGWSGDLSSFANPATVKINGSQEITATFMLTTAHNLKIDVIGGGIVQQEPNKPFYNTGDIVTLTAQASNGWIFSSWSGDLSGTENPVAILIEEDLAITATFKRAVFVPLVVTQSK